MSGMIESVQFGSKNMLGQDEDLAGVVEYDTDRDCFGILFILNGTRIRIEVPLDPERHTFPLQSFWQMQSQLDNLLISAIATLGSQSMVVAERLARLVRDGAVNAVEHMVMHGYAADVAEQLKLNDELVDLLRKELGTTEASE